MSILSLQYPTHTITNYTHYSTLLIQKGFSPEQRAHAQSTLYHMRLAGLINHGDKNQTETYRTKTKIKQLLELNLNETSRFITLTYQENITDYETSYKNFKKMITSFNQNKIEKLKYLVIKEHQKRGAIHYHMITFNHYDYDIISHWCRLGYGLPAGQNEKHIETFEPLRIANYLTKYLTKKDDEHQQIKKGFRAFSYSSNLKKPTKIRLTQPEEISRFYDIIDKGDGVLLAHKEDFKSYKYVLSKKHTKDLTPF